MSNAFNENFYIVAATTNPIFFLAVTLQGTFYGNLIGKINDVSKDVTKTIGKATYTDRRDVPWKTIGGVYLATGISFLAMAILIVGLGGEVIALFALYQQQDNYFVKTLVLWSTVGMISLATAIPGWAVARAFYNFEAASMKSFLGLVRNTAASLNREMRPAIDTTDIPQQRPDSADRSRPGE